MHDWAERELEHVRRVRKDRHLTPTAGALFECGAERDRLREALRGLLDEFVYQDGTFYLDEPIDDTIREAYKALGETVPVED